MREFIHAVIAVFKVIVIKQWLFLITHIMNIQGIAVMRLLKIGKKQRLLLHALHAAYIQRDGVGKKLIQDMEKNAEAFVSVLCDSR